MSRVRFHSIEAMGKCAHLEYTGPGWPGYNNEEDVQENIDRLFPRCEFDLVIAYKPLEMKSFSDIRFLKCLRYNEMYNKSITIKEITQSKANWVICHHYNDYVEYRKIFENFSLFPIKFINIPHSANEIIFKDYGEKKYDVLLAGSLEAQYYPLRKKFIDVIKELNRDGIRALIYEHPGYELGGASKNKATIEFAKIISASKIVLTCSSKFKYRLGKYIEVPMCKSVLAADIPDDQQAEFGKFILELNLDMSIEEICDKIKNCLNDNADYKNKIDLGHKYAMKYTMEKYSNRLLDMYEICTRELS